MYIHKKGITDDEYSICDTFKRKYAYQLDEEYYYVTNNTVYVYSNRWDTLEEATAWFTENEVHMCYLLADFTVEMFIPKDIVSLKSVNTIYSDCDTNFVSGRNDILWLTHSLVERIKKLEEQLANLS
jgi:hypothetical protein